MHERTARPGERVVLTHACRHDTPSALAAILDDVGDVPENKVQVERVVSPVENRSTPRRICDGGIVSVIVVTHNSADVITATLTAVREHMPYAELIVVDNGSTDKTCDLIARCPHARLIAGHGNVGYGSGVNLGAHASRGKLLVVLNPDAAPTFADETALSDLAGKNQLGLLGCQLREDGRTRCSPHVRWGWRRELSWSVVQWFLLPSEVELLRPRPRARSQRWISGAAFIASREEFLYVGGFDERLFLYYEDFDLSRKYVARGLPLASTDVVRLDHVGRASSPRDEDVMISCALMSLIEQTAKWEGRAMSFDAAHWAWRMLGAIEALGQCIARVPWIGPRGHRKANCAASVREHLNRAASSDWTDSYYPSAREALRSALGRA